MSLAEYIDSLKGHKEFSRDIVCHKTLPGKEGRYAKMVPQDREPVRTVINCLGIDRLYAHQEKAVRMIDKGIHTVIATPTASGKSLIYNLPVLKALADDPAATAIYLFPLKALARDQLATINTLLTGMGKSLDLKKPLTAAVYDGDLSAYGKRKIRDNPPNILLTNPEMLHLALLAHHGLWEGFFEKLKFIVVDEVHTYRGVMGSHMAWVFRRFRRICDFYGSLPVFIFCSATIANPKILASNLTDLAVSVVTANDAPSGRRDVLMMRGMAGAAQTAIQLMHAAIYRGIRTIVYTQSRKITELIALWASERAGKLAARISAYRAGFLPEERREIEKKLASGELLAVVSTSALELGIDIGNLDLCILVGYPGTIMSTWQRTGRVGRDGSDSAMIFVAHEDALDYYFMNNPDAFFAMPPEKAVINPCNPVVMERQLECAAADLSLQDHEPLVQHPGVQEVLAVLEANTRLLKSSRGDIWYASRKTPHRHVALRGTGTTLPIFLKGAKKSIGDIDRFRAFYETHKGAVYLHHGETFVVTLFDHKKNSIEVKRKDVGYFTRARSEKSTRIVEVMETKKIWNTRVGFGVLEVTDQVVAYERKGVKNQRSLGLVPLDLPAQTFETEGFWIEIPETVREKIERRQLHFMGGIHAMEHAAIGILPLLVMTDRNDLGGISIPYHPQTGKASVFVYDGIPGGAGLSREAFSAIGKLLTRILEVILNCRCESGCPGCVHSPKCGSGNRPIDKAAALSILHCMKGQERPEDFSFLPVGRALPHNQDQHEIIAGAAGKEPRFGVLDLETRRSAEEVGGWHRAYHMGVSCVVVYDSKKEVYKTYLQDDLKILEKDLQGFDIIVGFNINRFDYKVLSGLSSFDYLNLPTLDLLESIHQRLGYRLSLDNLAKATLNTKKSADGLMALKWWKEGKMPEIIDYCSQDVKVTRDIYLFGRDNGYLLFTNKAGMKVRLPVNW